MPLANNLVFDRFQETIIIIIIIAACNMGKYSL
jgi:hypothetical protein